MGWGAGAPGSASVAATSCFAANRRPRRRRHRRRLCTVAASCCCARGTARLPASMSPMTCCRRVCFASCTFDPGGGAAAGMRVGMGASLAATCCRRTCTPRRCGATARGGSTHGHRARPARRTPPPLSYPPPHLRSCLRCPPSCPRCPPSSYLSSIWARVRCYDCYDTRRSERQPVVSRERSIFTAAAPGQLMCADITS